MIYPDIAAYRSSGFNPKFIIIGSGPAGTTIARILARNGIPVTVLEAGGDEFSDESQEFYKGTTVGDPYFDLEISRLRFLGGSSNHWAGWCRVMDVHDFDAKPWVPDTGWPIARAAIEPFFPEVYDILELAPYEDDLPISDAIRWIQLQKSPAVHFGVKYRSQYETDPLIALVLNTSVSELKGNGQAITGAAIWSAGKPAGELTAEQFVLCTGGLENSRLLLWSNEQSGGAIVPHAAALGKYWMEHPQFEGGDAILTRRANFKMDLQNEAFFSPSPEAMAERGILNFGIRLIAMPYHGAKKVLANLACAAPSWAEWAAIKAGSHLRCAAQIYVGWEQAPLESNQIRLSATDRDAEGVPRIELHWRKSELETRTLHEGLRLFGETLVEKDMGRVRIADWVNDGAYPTDQELAGHHHMGGTRMGTDPLKSVVDSDCKVHGVANLHIGGSSVFPTSGQCNPTETITALAVRLGTHLAETAKKVEAPTVQGLHGTLKG